MLSQISAGASPKWNDLTYESSSRGSRRIDALPRLTSHKPEDFWGVSVPCKVPSTHSPFALPHLSAQTINRREGDLIDVSGSIGANFEAKSAELTPTAAGTDIIGGLWQMKALLERVQKVVRMLSQRRSGYSPT